MTGLYRHTLPTVYSSQFSFFIVALATPYGNYVMLVRTYITQFLSLWWLSVQLCCGYTRDVSDDTSSPALLPYLPK